MSKVIDDLAAKFMQACGESGESEERVIERLTKRLHVSRDATREFDATLTFGQRIADRIAIFGGSWTNAIRLVRNFIHRAGFGVF